MLNVGELATQGKGHRQLPVKTAADREQLLTKARAARKQNASIPHDQKMALVTDDGSALPIKYIVAGKNAQGGDVLFGYTSTKNGKGFFVTFREVRRRSGKVDRYDFSARRKRIGVQTVARGRALAFEGQAAKSN